MVVIFILLFFSVFYLAATLFLFFGLKRLSSSTAQNPHSHSFSIVIAAHNEEQTITACLQSVLSQTKTGGRYEVIVVDDRSMDATNQLLRSLVQKHSNLRVITVQSTPPGLSPKKHAVSLGIAEARNEIIVFTDADCRVPLTWLETIDRQFDENVGLVQGITVYNYIPGINAFFFGIQAVDFLSHGIVAAAAIGAGFPLNSNANNLAFKKATFDDVGGYGSAGSVVSGDDDLLLQRVWKSGKWKIKFMMESAGSVETNPAPTFSTMFEQRKRWGSKTIHYNAQQVLFLGGVFCFYLSLAASFIGALFCPGLWIAVAGMFVVKLAGELVLMVPGTSMFNKKELRKYILPASLLQLPLVVSAVVLGVFGRFKWKGQEFGRTIRINI